MTLDILAQDLCHRDPNVRIGAIWELKKLAGGMSETERTWAVTQLQALLGDHEGDDYVYHGFQCDEEAPQIFVCSAAADVLAYLDGANTVSCR